MTDSIKEKLIRKIQLMASYLAGDKIEFRIPTGSWKDTENPEWDWLHFEYRVKDQRRIEIETVLVEKKERLKKEQEQVMKYRVPSKLETALKTGKMSPMLKVMLIATKMCQQREKESSEIVGPVNKKEQEQPEKARKIPSTWEKAIRTGKMSPRLKILCQAILQSNKKSSEIVELGNKGEGIKHEKGKGWDNGSSEA